VLYGQLGTLLVGLDGNLYWQPDPGGGGEEWGGREPGGIPAFPGMPVPTPPPPGSGTIQAIAIYADTNNLSTCAQLIQTKTCIDTPGAEGCGTITGAKGYLAGTVFMLNANPYWRETQAGSTWSSWINMSLSTFAIDAYHPTGNYTPFLSCYNSTIDPTYQAGYSIQLHLNETISFVVGFSPTLPWFQVQGGGNTYGDQITNLMPVTLNPTYRYDTTAAPTSPGIVSVKTGADFSDNIAYHGTNNLSSTNWNTYQAMKQMDWYLLFKTRLLQGTVVPYEGTGGKPDRVADAAYTVYTTKDYMGGNLLINQPWVIADGEKLIIIVEGSLDIYAKINITGNGFVGFVVKDNIIIDGTVGTTWNGTIPLVEGMYIAGKSIKTGHSTDPLTERFVGKGVFVANDIILQRDLSTTAHNINTSADLFLYNPAFLVTAPDILKDLSYEWQEVAP
jgi:hypothetical protein